MEQLLSTKQVQEALRVDRTTIYRMLKDGRLTGVRVGAQWRFSSSEVQQLLSGSLADRPAPVADANEILPWVCLQPAQDVFAEMSGIGSVIIDRAGKPLTGMSNSCRFCSLILGSKKGRQACVHSWQQLANEEGEVPEFAACHAGLQYARAPITVSGEALAFLVGGQFYAAAPDPVERENRITALANRYSIDAPSMAEAAREIRVVDQDQLTQIATWLSQVARTFEGISAERADMLSRLHQISLMSHLDTLNPGQPSGAPAFASVRRYK